MSTIENKEAFAHLVGLVKHLNENFHKWLAFHLSIQTALIIAIATLIQWSGKNDGTLSKYIILIFGIFGIVIASLVWHILYRNRSWLKRYIEKAIAIEGDHPYIWETGGAVSGLSLSITISIAHFLVIAGWAIFLIVFICSGS